MSRRHCPFTEVDIKRLVHAVEAAGKEVHGINVSLDRREITVFMSKDVLKITSDMKKITPEEAIKLL